MVDSIRLHGHKKAIIVTARVHPGEPQGSFASEGIINFLLSKDEEAKQLRKNFVIYVVPMLNPDGVIQGNHRCSLLGVDLNRRWDAPGKWLHPTIYNAKNLIKMVTEEREISIFCDSHAHFRRRDAFMYCCCIPVENTVYYEARIKNAMLRVLPLLLSQRNKNFSFKDSTFKLEKFKETSARIVLFRELGIINSFTLESSFITQRPEPKKKLAENPEVEVSQGTHTPETVEATPKEGEDSSSPSEPDQPEKKPVEIIEEAKE